MQYKNCVELLENFMRDFLPILWRNKEGEELDSIGAWGLDAETVGALDRFAYWDSGMRDIYPETMQDLYKKLEFDRDREANVASPSAPADWGPTDWTFTVYVIRFVFLELLPPSQKDSFKSRPLSIQLLDSIEKLMERERTPSPHRERRGMHTPEPDKRTKELSSLLAQRVQSVDALLLQLKRCI